MTSWTLVVGWTLVHFLWQGAVIGAAAALALRLLRHATAQARYLTACAALTAAMAAPFVTAPSLGVLESVRAMSPAVRGDGTRSPALQAVEPAPPGREADSMPVPQNNDETTLPVRILPSVVFVWAAGVLLLTARLTLGWWRVRRLHASALIEPASRWLPASVRLADRLGLRRPIHVVDSPGVATPTVIGWLRPVVLLPVAALANLSPDQVQAILAHELAHVRRHDFLVNLLQTIAETVLFYHPVVWWLSARIRAEREHCCDDIAVEVCGDAIIYAEALTELASCAAVAPPLAVGATGGLLLRRVRRLLRLPADPDRRRARAPVVIAATVLCIAVVGFRFMVVAQGSEPAGAPHDAAALPAGPAAMNRLVGFNLFPRRAHYPTDDPLVARTWDVAVAFPGGEMRFIGFTAREVVRYAYELDGDAPVMDGPGWLDTESLTLHVSTPATTPEDADFRSALRIGLQEQYGVTVNHAVRDFPVYALVVASADGRLGANIHRSTVECLEGRRPRPVVFGPELHARGQLATLCGIDNSLFGPTGYRVSMAEFARSLHGFPMGTPLDHVTADREVIDQTGLAGEFDFTLRLGPLPLALIASAHPDLSVGLRPFGVHTFAEAIERQLGLRLEPTEAPREVTVIASASRPAAD